LFPAVARRLVVAEKLEQLDAARDVVTVFSLSQQQGRTPAYAPAPNHPLSLPDLIRQSIFFKIMDARV
jgi:hypothetical protein